MTNHEDDPSSEIVNLETFAAWVEHYREQMIADPEVKHDTVPIPAPNIMFGESVNVFGIPWKDVPVSIKEVISMKYQAALDSSHERSIDIIEGEGHLKFIFNSPLVVNGVDTVTETDNNSGVTLHFAETGPERVHNGTWGLDTALTSAREIIRGMFFKEGPPEPIDTQRFLSALRFKSTSITLPQMHDVAHLLIKAKPYTVVLRGSLENKTG